MIRFELFPQVRPSARYKGGVQAVVAFLQVVAVFSISGWDLLQDFTPGWSTDPVPPSTEPNELQKASSKLTAFDEGICCLSSNGKHIFFQFTRSQCHPRGEVKLRDRCSVVRERFGGTLSVQ